jgi:hypothetical protein
MASVARFVHCKFILKHAMEVSAPQGTDQNNPGLNLQLKIGRHGLAASCLQLQHLMNRKS